MTAPLETASDLFGLDKDLLEERLISSALTDESDQAAHFFDVLTLLKHHSIHDATKLHDAGRPRLVQSLTV